MANQEMLARALGWTSLGLGITYVVAPRRFARLIGLRGTDGTASVVRGVGFREIGSGIGVLTSAKPSGWLWSRVGGDAMDLALLGKALTSKGSSKGRVAMASAAIIGISAADYLASRQMSKQRTTSTVRTSKSGVITVRSAMTVNRPREEVYHFWRDFQNLPRFMRHLESVKLIEGGRSVWKATAPAGMTVEWEAETVENRPEELISWRSLPGSDVENAGTVRFVTAPGGRGTEVHLEIRYKPPAGKFGAVVAKLFGEEPGQQARNDLRVFKQVLETGEAVRSDAVMERPRMVQRPAQPPEKVQAAPVRGGVL